MGPGPRFGQMDKNSEKQSAGTVSSKNDFLNMASIEKLDGVTNYSSWKFLMELYLIHEDLWEYTYATPIDEIGKKRDQKARSKICLMIKPECLIHVRQTKTAKEAWQALEKAYEDKGLNNRCRLLSKLVSLKLEQFTTIRDYISTLMTTAQKLCDLGKEIDDELLAALMLQGLTDNFQAMRLAIENSNIELTTDYVKTKLYQMEDTHTATTSTSNHALMSKNKQKQKKQKKFKCFVCNGPHKARDCPDNPSKKRNEAYNALAMTTSASEEEVWIVDSGASNHMTSRREWLHDFQKYEKGVTVACANGESLQGVGSGTVVCRKPNVTINAMYVPRLAANLLSVSAITKKDHKVVFYKGGFNVVKSSNCNIIGEPLLIGIEENGVYKLKQSLKHTALVTTISGDEMGLWHRRMGHLGVRNLKLLRNIMATGVSFPNNSTKIECVACLKGKQTRQPFKKSRPASRADSILELVHTDVCGPMAEESFSGFKYFLTFIDDYTRKTFVYFLKCKSEVFNKLEKFKIFAELQTGQKLKTLRSDNGKEYVNKQMNEFMKKHGINHQLTVEYTPEQNGVAERANRTIVEKSRSMIQEAGLSNKLWAEAVNTAVYLKNRSPTKAVRNKTPEEAWTGRKQNLKFIRVFGCKAFMHIPKQKRTKWDPKSKELLHIGYCEDSKAYRLFDPETKMVHKGRDVVFFENQFQLIKKSLETKKDEMSVTFDHENPPVQPTNTEIENEEELQEQNETVRENEEELQKQNETVREITTNNLDRNEESDGNVSESCDEWESLDERDEEVLQPEPELNRERRYSLRERKPKQFPDHITYQAIESDLPLTVDEALSKIDKEKWRKAIQEELDALKQNNTWILVKPPACPYNIVDSKWIFRIKEEVGGKRYKARLVARGYSQRRGIDYHETFAPVVRHSSLRTLIALAAKLDLQIDQMDVKTAFLNGDLKEVVYMKQPNGFKQKGKEDYVCLLKKSLYGLKQAPRSWNMKLDEELTKLNFKRSLNEPCVYTRTKGKSIIILAVYVDDILLFWNNVTEMKVVKQELMSKFKMKDLGKAELMLGIQIKQTLNSINLSQEKYIEKLLREFGMEDAKVVATPEVTGQRLEKPPSEHKSRDDLPYRALIGSLMYLAVCTRPDIAHSVNSLSQFNSSFDESHWIAAKRVLRYLKGTKNHGLKYIKGHNKPVEGYADADHAGEFDRRSYSGLVFIIQGGAISWESKKQRTIALSTAEAEYVSLSEAAREAIFLRRFIAEVTDGQCFKLDEPMTIYSDSQSAIAIAKNPVHHQRTKHVDVRYHFVREAIVNNEVILKYKETACMVADGLTKPLPRVKFEWCVKGMGVCV